MFGTGVVYRGTFSIPALASRMYFWTHQGMNDFLLRLRIAR